jgi:hypothetical protein
MLRTKKMKDLRIVSLALLVLASGCSTVSKPPPDPTRQPWRDSWAALPAAKAGDPDGLRRFFSSARAQLQLPYINGGEDAEAIYENVGSVLESTGDQRFSEALLREAPETRSAVREFLSEADVKQKFPVTHRVLAAAPVVKWPSDIAYEQSVAGTGEEPPPKALWTP